MSTTMPCFEIQALLVAMATASKLWSFHLKCSFCFKTPPVLQLELSCMKCKVHWVLPACQVSCFSIGRSHSNGTKLRFFLLGIQVLFSNSGSFASRALMYGCHVWSSLSTVYMSSFTIHYQSLSRKLSADQAVKPAGLYDIWVCIMARRL